MSPQALVAETRALRNDLAQLARIADVRRLARRYALREPPHASANFYRRLRRFVGRIVRRFGFRVEPWSPGLNHFERSNAARPFLIWALDVDRDTLREACSGFETQLTELTDWVPVLVTDVTDFAFFSRLGWLVEYVPALSAPAGDYAERKKQYLAWRYRSAPALPVSAGLSADARLQELLVG